MAGEGEEFALAGSAAYSIPEIDLRGEVGLVLRGDGRGERHREVVTAAGRGRRPSLVEHVEGAHVLRRIVLGPSIGGDTAELLEAMDVHLVAGDLIGGDVDGGEHETSGEFIHGFRCDRCHLGSFRGLGGLGRLRGGQRIGEDEAQSGDGLCGLRGLSEDIEGGLGDAFELIPFDGEAAAAVGRGDLEQFDRDEFEAAFPVGFPLLLRALPLGEHLGIWHLQPSIESGDPFEQGGELIRLEDGLPQGGGERVHAGVAVGRTVVEGIEEGEHPEVVLLADRIELMVVALRASEGQAEDGFTEGLHAVGVVVDEVLGGNRATLVGVHVVALESGGDELAVVGIRHEVAGDLLRDEAVVGLVVVEGLDDPVAPEPEVTPAVDGEAVGVGVTGGIQPIEAHAFAEVGTG